MKNSIKQIQVLGSGCPTCKKLFELTKQAVEELGLKTEVEYITDIQKIVEMGVMQSPVLAINGKPVIAGSVSDIEKIKKIISDCSDDSGAAEKKSGCSCGGNC
ncbi:MAG: thioredoxin family protein [Candidatus Paceibacterota bacterium]